MTAVVRLTLVCHAMTDAVAAARFPADEPLDARGVRQIAAALGLAPVSVSIARAVCGPERRTRQSAEGLGLRAEPCPDLADLDSGRWRGRTLDEVVPDELTRWLTDPADAPHGGESLVALVARVRGWLTSLDGPTVAVTHPAVIRAAVLVALDAPPSSFWRVDVAPSTRTVLHGRDGRWTLRAIGESERPG